MAWVKLDDQFDTHRKLDGLSLAAVGLHARALSYCARYETDGVVDLRWLKTRAPRSSTRDRLTRELREAGLWEELTAGEVRDLEIRGRVPKLKTPRVVRVGPSQTDGFLIHDFLEYNDSRSEACARREYEANKKAAQRAGESEDVPAGHRAESKSPDPTRPVQTDSPTSSSQLPNRDGGQDERARVRAQIRASLEEAAA